jgi:Ca2+-binding RTX toxin-like protein
MNDPIAASIGNPLAAFSNQSTSSFTVDASPASFVASSLLSDFSYLGGTIPIGGTITGVEKLISNVEQYDVSGLNITIGSVISTNGAVLETSAILAGNDMIMGSPFADQLIGGTGNDTIDGGGGNDTESGGPGNDQFVFDTKLNAHANVVHITDFTHAEDFIDLSGHIFENRVGGHLVPIHVNAHTFYAARGAHTAHSASTQIIYNSKSGALYFDPDGTGHKPAVEFAVLDGHPHIAFHDFQMVA